jgi:hypothetical protein
MRHDRIHNLPGMTNHRARLLHALWLFVTFPYRPAVAAPLGFFGGALIGYLFFGDPFRSMGIGVIAAFLIATPVNYLLARVAEREAMRGKPQTKIKRPKRKPR